MAILVPPEQVPIPKPDMATPAVDFIQNTQLETPQEREQRHNLFRQSISPAVLPKNPVLKTAPVPNPQTQSVVDPTDASSGMDYLASRFTSPEQEERYRKASVNRQRILAIGDALRHIGNIYNTVNYAPSQQFNDPIGTEYQRYQTDKNARDAANQRYISYQQAKAAQEAKQRQWEYEQARKDKEFAWKQDVDNRNFGETRRKTDAYVATQQASADATKARAEKTRKEGEWVDRLNEDKLKNSENQRWARTQQVAQGAQRVAQGWANYNLKVSREQRIRRGSSLQGVSKDRELYSSPDGSTYSFPKGTVNTKNINTIFSSLVRTGVISGIGLDATTDGEKWDAIMTAAGTSKKGHDAFIFHAKRLGYNYEGGMKPDVYQSYYGTPAPKPAAQAASKPKPAAKPAPKPAQKPAAKTSGTRTTTGNTVSTNQNNLSKLKGKTI